MSKLILLMLTFILGCVFMILPDWDGVTYMNPDPFYFYDFGYNENGERLGIWIQTYVFMIGEHVTMIILSFMIAKEATIYKMALWIFFGLVVVDLFDYLLTYNSVWYRLHLSHLVIPVSINTLKVTIFGLAILNEWRKKF